MSYLHSIFLGAIQGLTEFLPISSSGHLVILPWAFHFPDPGLTFDVSLHGGTLIAILFYFWKDWIQIITGSLRAILNIPRSNSVGDHTQNKQSLHILILLMIASIPGALAGLFLDELAETTLRHPLLVALDMSLLGALLWFADNKAGNGKELSQLQFKDALLIGVSQAFALFPGVSRSGITMTTGLFLGLNRVTAARFSFLMATPITLGAFVFKMDHLLKEGLTGPMILGVLMSAFVGFLAIKYLLKYVQLHNYRPFVIYRFIFSVVVVLLYLF